MRALRRLPWGVLYATTSLLTLAPLLPAQLTESAHVQERMGFGPTAEGTEFIESVGLQEWIDRNLDAAFTEPNPRLDTLTTALNLVEPWGSTAPSVFHPPITDLVEYQIARALYSRNQLTEQMTRFWNNHFSTFFPKAAGYLQNGSMSYSLAYSENEAYRANGLGRFRDVLETSVLSPLMIIYLDTVLSESAEPNENYARELLELHCLGDFNYTQTDVQAAAALFAPLTLQPVDPADYGDPLADFLSAEDIRLRGDFNADGWTDGLDLALWQGYSATGDLTGDLNGDGQLSILDLAIFGQFYLQRSFLVGPWFDENDYVPGDKVFDLGGGPGSFTIDEGFTRAEKYGEIVQLVDFLASYPTTAGFVSAKLIAKFVHPVDPDDLSTWPADLVTLHGACVQAWLATDGEIREVLREIFDSVEFRTGYTYTKSETPFESAASVIRSLEEADLNVGLVASTAQLVTIRAFVEEESRQSLFGTGPPDGYPENDRPGGGDLLGRIRLHLELLEAEAIDVDWRALIDLSIDETSPLLPAAILGRLHGPNNYSSNDELMLSDYRWAILQPGGVSFHELCTKLAAMAASFPQGFRQ